MRKALKLILILALFSFLISGCTKQSPTPSTQDTTPPQISITSPQNGQTVSGTITIQASATDNMGVKKVEFYIDGSKVGEDTVSPYEYIWDTIQYANGNHTITAKAYDNVGNVGSISIIVNVQNIYQNVWQKTYGGSNNDWANSIQQTKDGGYIVAGWTTSFGAGEYDVYIIKLDGNGNKVWEKTFGGSNNDEAYSIQQTSDGGYIVAGGTYSFVAGGWYWDVYVIKLDANGKKVWERTYGGSGDDVAFSIQQTTDGGYIVAGITNSMGAGGSDAYIIKLDENGNKVWEKTYGGSDFDTAWSIQQTNDGGYIVAGYTFLLGNVFVYVIKLDANGNKVWEKTHGGSGDDVAKSIQQTTDGGYIVAGITNSMGAGGSDAYIIKLDENGNKVWEKTYGGSYYDAAYSIQQTSDGGYIVAGGTNSFGIGVSNIYIIKMDENGNTGPYPQ